MTNVNIVGSSGNTGNPGDMPVLTALTAAPPTKRGILVSEGRRKSQRVPHSRVIYYLGGEENVKKVRDPLTGALIYSENYKDPRSRWYGYKKYGWPPYVVLPYIIERYERPLSRIPEDVRGRAEQISKAVESLGPETPDAAELLLAIDALLKLALRRKG